MIHFVKFLPLVMSAECVGAAILYAMSKDWRHTVYWLSAVAINFTATLL